MSADSKRIIVTESCCHACRIHTFLVHHQAFPEMRMENMSAEPRRHASSRTGWNLLSEWSPIRSTARRSGWRLTTPEPSSTGSGDVHSSCNVHGRPIGP